MAATTIIFDLDGTLWDSIDWYASVIAECSGASIDDIAMSLRGGKNVIRLARDIGLSNSRLSTACRSSVDQLKLYEDVVPVLNALAMRRIPMGVVTNVPQRIAEPILEHFALSDFFNSRIFAASKPSPRGINQVLMDLGCQPDPAVYYVGDTQGDADAAERAGISFAWAAYGYSGERPAFTTIELQRFSDVSDL